MLRMRYVFPTRLAHQHDVLLGVVSLFFTVKRLAHGVVVVAQRHAQHLLGFVLLDDIAVEMGFYVPWLVGKTEVISLGFGLVSSSVPDGCELAKPGLPNDLNCFCGSPASVFEIPPVKPVHSCSFLLPISTAKRTVASAGKI